MTSAPLPTRLVFLNDLQSIAPGEKVRFLGWYIKLILHHSGPR